MAPEPSKNRTDAPAVKMPGDMARAWITLALLIHGFLIFLVLSGNYSRSPLQEKLAYASRVYTQLFNFDLDYTPYYLTHADVDDVDHRIEILPKGGDENNLDDWRVLPDAGWRGGERYKRYQRLSKLTVYWVDQEEVAALLARDVAANELRQRGIEPAQVRYRRHLLQSPEYISGGTPEQRDPDSSTYFRTPYAANVLIVGDGKIQIVKKDPDAEVAKPRAPETSSEPATGPSNNE